MNNPNKPTLIVFDYQGTLAVRGTLVTGIDDVIKNFASQHILCIVSASSREHITETLSQKNLSAYFTKIISQESLSTKAAAIASLLTEYGVEKTQCFFITDTHDDIATAKTLDITPIFVTWGNESIPTDTDVPVVDNPQEIFSIITKK